MSDWRYDYRVDNDPSGDQRRLQKWRREGLDRLDPNDQKTSPWFVTIVVITIIVCVVYIWHVL